MKLFSVPVINDRRVGFTIVELLIVIVVIAILASIVIVSYNGIIARSHEVGVQVETGQGAKALSAYKLSNSTLPGDCATAGVKVSDGNTLTCNISSDGQSFCLSVAYQNFSYYATDTNPTPVAGICSGFVGVNAGTEHTMVSARGIGGSCGVFGGRAYCWGDNYAGQLGNGTTTDSSVPVPVSVAGVLAGKTVSKVAVGSADTSCAIADGAAYCWGVGSDGKLGNGASSDSSIPVAVSAAGALSGKTVTDIQVGIGHVCALADGQLYCWGYNGTGVSSNFGNGAAQTSSNVPVLVSNSGILAGKTISDFTLDGYGGPNCVVADGAPYCWGYNGTGGMGNGTSGGYATTPVAVDISGALAGKTVTDITSYEYHVCVVASGAAYCWGGNGSAQLGKGNNGGGTDSYVPVAVTASGALSGKTVTAISAGDYFTCAIADGQAHCWGDNLYGTLGDGSPTGTDALNPVAVSTAGVLAGKTVTQISSGYGHVCAIADGRTHCWGANWSGSLGNGSTVQSGVPVLVTTS